MKYKQNAVEQNSLASLLVIRKTYGRGVLELGK